MDPRNLVQQLLNLRRRVSGWYQNSDTTAIDTAISIIKRFCYPEKPIIIKTNGSKQYFCPRCRQKIQRNWFWCASCGGRLFVDPR